MLFRSALAVKKFYGLAVTRNEEGRATEWQPKPNETNEQLAPKLIGALEYAKQLSKALPDDVYRKSGANPEYTKKFFEIRNSLSSEPSKEPPRMTGDNKKDKETWDSLTPGDSYIDTSGKLRTK